MSTEELHIGEEEEIEPPAEIKKEEPLPAPKGIDLTAAQQGKNYLQTLRGSHGDCLYEHLVDIANRGMSVKPKQLYNHFKEFSHYVGEERLNPVHDLYWEIYLPRVYKNYLTNLEDMFSTLQFGQTPEIGGEEEDVVAEEDEIKPRIADIIDHNDCFRQGGFGLPEWESYAVYLGLIQLGMNKPVADIRFFGKIYGTTVNYYVAETELTNAELERRIREFDRVPMPGEGGEGEAEVGAFGNAEEMMGEGAPQPPKPKGPQPPKLPSIPESTFVKPAPIPTERPGQGANRKVYWICTLPGQDWVCMPDVTPQEIREARLAAHVVTENLDAEVQTFPFTGLEKNYLRAQIARIAAATAVSPQGFYVYGSGEEEEDISPEEGMGDIAFSPNPHYRGHTISDLMDTHLAYWVHHGRYILKQGRTIWWNPNVPQEEAEEEEEPDHTEIILPETGPSLFTPLSEDTRMPGGFMRLWTPMVSTILNPDRALVLLRSNLWPGAAAYATSGRKSECIYIGWGLKKTFPNFSIKQLPWPQREYAIGPEVMEIPDPTFADEEAYRIAHMPPPPPSAGGGEGEFGQFGAEGEEEEAEEEEE